MERPWYCNLIFAVALTLTAFAPIAAQQVRTTGEIRGTVTDFSAALAPGVNLKAKDLATGVIQTTITSATGAYAFLNLQAGAYEVTASAPGFQTTVFPRVVVETARTVDVDIRLTVGQ